MRTALIAILISVPALAQTVSNVVANNSLDLTSHSTRITANTSIDGWYQIEYGTTSGGPYPYLTAPYCTSSPHITFSGGGGSGAQAYVLTLNGSGSIGIVEMFYSGTGYTTAPSVGFTDTCIPEGGAAGTGATATATIAGGSVTGINVTATGTGYHVSNTSTNGEYLGNGSPGNIILAIGGLAPSRTYYFKFIYRPHANDATGQTTSSEFSFTTLAGTTSAVLPTPPLTVWNPTAVYPSFTTGYTLVEMASSGADCVATASVGPIPYGSGTWRVTAGDSVQTVLNEVGYGAILEFAQGTTCKVPTGSTPYILPAKAIDPTASGVNDPNHRFIVLRTRQINASDFPPAGFRTGPQWASKLANLQAQSPNGAAYNNPVVFTTDPGSGLPHHYWTYNLEESTSGAGNWGGFMLLGFNDNPPAKANPPIYIVIDRVYFDSPTRVANTTTMANGIAGIPGGNVAITNNYLGQVDSNNPLPQGIYFTDCGQGPLYVDNNYIAAIGQGFYIESNGVPYCSSVVPTSFATQTTVRSYDDVTLTHNSFYWPAYTLDSNSSWDGLPRDLARQQIEAKIGRRWNLSGNSINGQWCAQTAGAAIDISSDLSTNLAPGEQGDTDWTIVFNLFTNAAYLLQVDGTKGVGQVGPPDNSINSRILFANNLGFGLGKNKTHDSTSCAGLGPGYFNFTGGPQDVTIQNNTMGNESGDIGNPGFAYATTWLQAGGGVSLTAGFTYRSNIQYLSGGGSSGYYGILPDTSSGCSAGSDCSNFPASPLINNSDYPASDFASAFVSNGATAATSVYNWGANIEIGGWFASSLSPWTDMTQAQINALSANLPSGDIYVSGATTAARQIRAGLLGVANNNYTCVPGPQNPCAAGVNLQGLESLMGIVRNIVVRSGPNGLQFSYIAPDARTCAIDTSPNGTTWTRTVDAGASRVRTTVVPGLSANSAYQYRVMCYFSQTAPWFTFPSDASNLTTDGVTAFTAAAGTRTLPVTFRLPAGAASAQLVVTPVGGTPISQTCFGSPCGVSNVPNGAVLLQITYLNGLGAPISSGTLYTQ